MQKLLLLCHLKFIELKKRRPPVLLYFLLTITMLAFAATANSQNLSEKKVTLDLHGVSIKEALEAIQKQSDVRFLYTQGELAKYAAVKVTVVEKNASVKAALITILKNTNLHYVQMEDQIVIEENPAPKTPGKLQTTGSIKGRIVDFETTEPLPGASIYVPELGRGTTADDRGYYRLDGLNGGSYTLQITFIGYEVQTIKTDVDNGKTVPMDIKLKAASSELKEVVVTQRQALSKTAVSYSSDKELLSTIRMSTSLISGISNEQIVKSADRNAAEVVKRISGVTVMDDRFIVVRGMSERYNLTYLNSNLAPSTELYNKAFAYDLLPSSIIDNILVYKSPVANLVADYAGAAVKINTKNAVPVRHFDIGIQLAHRPGSTMADIVSYQGGKYDFLGLDDGTRKLPAFSPDYFQSNKPTLGVDQATMVKGFSSTLGYGMKHSLPDGQLYLNFLDNWRLGKARLYNLTSLTYTHETRYYNIYRQTGNTYAYLSDAQSNSANQIGLSNMFSNNRQSTEIGKINVLENLTLKLNDRHSISLKNYFVNEGRVLTNINDSRRNMAPTQEVNYGSARLRDITLSFEQRRLYSGSLGGTHALGQKGRHEVNWNLGYTFDRQWVPDQRISHFAASLANTYSGVPAEPDFDLHYTATGTNSGAGTDIKAGTLGMISRLFIKNQEDVYNASLDYAWHANPALTVHAGTYQMFKSRRVGRRIFRVNAAAVGTAVGGTTSSDEGWSEGDGLSNLNTILFREQDLPTIWDPANFRANNTGLRVTDVTSPVDSYVASEQNNAGYVMGDWKPLGNAITVNAGLRVEYDEQRISGANKPSNNGDIVSVTTSHPLTSVLPSVNLSYRPDSAFVIRLGAGRTVNRPDFREITPYNDFDYQNNLTILGNPRVVSAKINNYDLRVEFYPASALQNEVLNVGVFYKTLDRPIERFRTDISGVTDPGSFNKLSFGNAYSAKVYGIEVEARKSLAFAGRFFRNLSVVANATWNKSTTQEFRPGLNSGYVLDSGAVYKGRPLQGQSPYIINGGLYYENPATGTRISVTCNVNGPRIYAKSVANPNYDSLSPDAKSIRPDLLELPRPLLDLAITQRIVSSLQAKFSIQNLLDTPIRIIEDRNYNQKYDREKPITNPDGLLYYTGDNISTKYYPGRYFVIQLTYSF